MRLISIRKGRRFAPLNPQRHKWTICYRVRARTGEQACRGSYIFDRNEVAWQAVCK